MTQVLPPAKRTRLGQAMTEATLPGSLHLQHCQDCAAVQYPPRELCYHCLGDQLNWCATEPAGAVLASTDLHHSLEPWFRERSPWLMGSIKLDCGPVVLAHLAPDCAAAGSAVWVLNQRDASGQAVLMAVSQSLDLDQAGAAVEELILRNSEGIK